MAALGPFSAIWPRNSCIAQTRIVVDIFTRLKIPVRPITCSLVVAVEERDYAYISGFTDKERGEIARQAKHFGSRYSGEELWRGHAFALVDGWLVDTALDQASAPEHGFYMYPDILSVYVGNRVYGKRVDLVVELRTGERVKINYYPRQVRGIQKTEAWKMAPHMRRISDVVTATVKALLGRGR